MESGMGKGDNFNSLLGERFLLTLAHRRGDQHPIRFGCSDLGKVRVQHRSACLSTRYRNIGRRIVAYGTNKACCTDILQQPESGRQDKTASLRGLDWMDVAFFPNFQQNRERFGLRLLRKDILLMYPDC